MKLVMIIAVINTFANKYYENIFLSSFGHKNKTGNLYLILSYLNSYNYSDLPKKSAKNVLMHIFINFVHYVNSYE